MAGTRVLLVGIDPALIDFSGPEYAAFPGLTAEKVRAGIEESRGRLDEMGYDAQVCMTDLGGTAGEVVRQALDGAPFDCVMIGAGVRLIAANTPLFETLVNAVHEHAPRAKLCFNTNPTDTADAVRRWAPAGRT